MKDSKVTPAKGTFSADDFRQAFFTILQAKVGRQTLLLEDAYGVTLKQVAKLALVAEQTIRQVILDGGIQEEE